VFDDRGEPWFWSIVSTTESRATRTDPVLAPGASVSIYHTSLNVGATSQSTTFVVTKPQGMVRAFYP
jgi:hypothetical protein